MALGPEGFRESTCKLSVVVVSYNMPREIPRTLRSLSTAMQRDVSADDYEVILVDNGSTEPFDERLCREHLPGLRIHRMQGATPSPVPAVNAGIALARGELVGVLIDGARLASPRMLSLALDASRVHDTPVIGTLAFHLGPDTQMRSMKRGYCREQEDRLLLHSRWEEDGYALFDIASFAGASGKGWFVVPNECNALFLKRRHWHELGGYDEAFTTPGGGLTNHDMWSRASGDPAARVIILMGEATFHQIHGGIATNAVESKRELFRDEYLSIRGHAYRKPRVEPLYFGHLNSRCIESMARSIRNLQPSASSPAG